MASQMASLVSSNEVREGTIIDVHECINNMSGTKCIVIILGMTIVKQDEPRIGNPVTVMPPRGQEDGGGAPGGPAGMDPGAAAMLGMPQQPHQAPPPQQGGYGGAYGGGGAYGAPPPQQQQQPQYGAYGAPPPQPAYGAPPPNPYGAPPPAAAAGPYGAPPPNPYGAPPPAAAPQMPPQHQQQQQPPQQQYGGGIAPQYRPAAGGAIARNEAPVQLTPINALNSYQNRWTIKARVTQKSDIRRFSNARGEGKFFSFDILDADGGEIRVVGWNDQCDKFFDQVTVGQVYMISKASLRNKRGNYNQTRHQFEVHLETTSLLEPVQDEIDIPRISFSFVPLSQIEDTPAGGVVDIIAVVESVAEPTEITRRDGTPASKRAINIRDNSGRSIELTLWGGYASNPGDSLAAAIAAGKHPILAVKSARVGDYNGKTLSTVSSTTIVVDPVDTPEAGNLKTWYDNGGANTAAQALSSARAGGGRQDRRICISQIKGESMGLSGAPAYVQAVGHLLFIRSETFCYPACPLQYNGKQCNKKLMDQTGDGTAWTCERCNASATPEYRYILNFQMADHTDNVWPTAFNEAAPDILGKSAGELKELGDMDDPRFPQTFREAQYRLVVAKLKVAEDNYNEERKLRTTVVRVDPADMVAETRWTLDAISRLERGEPAYPVIAPGGAAAPAGAGGFGGGGYGGPQAAAPAAQYGGGAGGGYGGAPQAQPQYQQQQGQWGAGAGAGGGGGYNAPPVQGGGWGGQQQGGYGGGAAAGGGYGGAPPQQQWGAPQQNAGGYGGGGGGGGGYGGGGW